MTIPFDPVELRAMQDLAHTIWSVDPSFCNGDSTVGELAWCWASAPEGRRGRWRIRQLPGDSGLSGWGWITVPEPIRLHSDETVLADAGLVWQARPGETEILESILRWCDSELQGAPCSTRPRTHDRDSIAVLEEHGYVRESSAPWTLLMIRDLVEIDEPVVPDGYRLSSMAEFGDIERRVEVHRKAWHPSKQTVATYTQVTKTWPYRSDLDVIVVAPDGSVASSVLVWHDPENGVGELEPVGTDPAHQRLGLARAASLFALRKLAAAGAITAAVSCRGDDDYPVPKCLYESVGFRELARDCAFRKA